MKRLLGAGVLLLGFAACGEEAVEETAVPRPIVAEAVSTVTGSTLRSFSGTAQTGRTVNLSFRSSGVVTELNMVLGQRVRRGELLAELDNVASRLAYEQAVLGLNSAASQMNTAELAFQRTRALYESGTASLSEYENARNAYRTAEASHASAERSVQIQEEQIEYGRILAPADGTIASVNVEIDENVSPGQAIATLNVGSELEIALGLPEAVIARAMPGMEANVQFAAVAGQSFAGRVTEVSPSVDPATATYPVRISIDGPSDAIRPGMAATVELAFDSELPEGVLVVPAKAVGENAEGRFVFLVEDAGGGEATVRRQPVTVGRLTGEGFEVVEGLAEGQRVATAGLQTLLEGQRVRVR